MNSQDLATAKGTKMLMEN